MQRRNWARIPGSAPAPSSTRDAVSGTTHLSEHAHWCSFAAELAAHAWVGAAASIGAHAKIGTHCVIGADVRIGAGAEVGRYSPVERPGHYAQPITERTYIDPLFENQVRIYGAARNRAGITG